MFNYKLTLQYDGTRYAGWQIQENALSVQEVIKRAIQQILQEEVNLIGAGRTDSVLPDDISITNIEVVDENFHSRFSAKKRSYIYLISIQKSPFFDRYSYNYYSELNQQKLNEISSVMIGSKDFTSFSKLNPEVQNKNCEVFEARWRKEKNLFIFYIEANRFLYGMVRATVGTLLKAYSSESAIEYLENVFAKKNRDAAADAVPSKGLFLYKIKY
jgi:tRNA pseudouridine38-40 synthase